MINKKKKLQIILCLFFSFALTGCGTTKITNVGILQNGKKNIDYVAQNYKYEVSYNDNQIIYVFVYNDNNYKINKFNVSNNNKINIEVPDGEKFIISLLAYKTVTYTWNIKNELDKNILSILDKKWIDVKDDSTIKQTGGSPDRQNFYFQTKGEGMQTLKLKNEQQKEPESTVDPFEVVLEVKVIK